jgi:aminopeptidase
MRHLWRYERPDAVSGELFRRRSAELAVRVGLNLRPGQFVLVVAPPELAANAREVARCAWQAGAGDVELFYFDSQQTFLLAEYGREEILDRTTIAEEAIVRALFKLQPALVQVLGDLAPPHAELDPARLAKTVPRLAVELNQKLLRERGMAWNVIAAPTETWAERLFGEPDVERLERLVARAMRLDCADPVAAWRERLAALLERRQLVDGCGFDALQFRGPGTDLAVPLAPNTEWESASGGRRGGGRSRRTCRPKRSGRRPTRAAPTGTSAQRGRSCSMAL